VPGELYVSGAGLARGYLHRPDLTAEAFVPHPFRPGERIYRTGDRARWRSDGTLEYLGRLDEQVKLRGFRIELGEIKAQLLAQPGVAAAAVVVAEAASGAKQLVAYVVPEAGTTSAPDEAGAALRAALRATLPDYMVPASVMLLDALPLTPNGKLDLAALPAPDYQRVGAQRATPSSELERAIAAIWQDVLKQPAIGLHDSFFDLGGHSLLLIQVHGILQQRHPQLTVVDMFRYPTISALAAHLSSRQPEQTNLQEHQERAQKQREAHDRRKQVMKTIERSNR
jgi:hypothetical protein